MSEQNDHDILLGLVEQVKNLVKQTEANTIRVEGSIRELRDGIVARLERVEATKLNAQDFINKIGEMAADHKEFNLKIEKLENQQVYWKGGLAVLAILFSTFALYIWEKLIM